MTNNELMAAWKKKMPDTVPTDREMSAFALGVEVGQGDAVNSKRLAIMFGDIMSHQIIAMRAAVVESQLRGAENGMEWIVNTLEGPGNLPDLDEARELGGAQALFDKEVAEQEAFREAHPV